MIWFPSSLKPEPGSSGSPKRPIHVEVLTRGRLRKLTLFQRLKLWLLALLVMLFVAAFVGIGLGIGLLLVLIVGAVVLVSRITALIRKKKPLPPQKWR